MPVRYQLSMQMTLGATAVRLNDLAVRHQIAGGEAHGELVNECLRPGRNELLVEWRPGTPPPSFDEKMGPPCGFELRLGPTGPGGEIQDPLVDAPGRDPPAWRLERTGPRAGRWIAPFTFMVDDPDLVLPPCVATPMLDAADPAVRREALAFVRRTRDLVETQDLDGLVDSVAPRTAFLSAVHGIPLEDATARTRAWWKRLLANGPLDPLPDRDAIRPLAAGFGRALEIIVDPEFRPPLATRDPNTGLRMEMPITVYRSGGFLRWFR